MRYLNRWTLTGVVLVCVFCGGLIVAELSFFSQSANKTRFDRIEYGTQKSEVMDILGADRGRWETLPDRELSELTSET